MPALSSEASAAPWIEDKAFFSENLSNSSSKVDAADLNGDGFIDLVFANGGGFDKGDLNSDQPQQAFFNNAGAGMTDVSDAIFGPGQTFNGRAVKLRDIDNDGDNDIILGTTWESQSQLFINNGGGNFSNETATNLPKRQSGSIGDIEVGDVDGDGSLDLLLADWGADSPVSLSAGGITQLWMQDSKPDNWSEPSTGTFMDVTLGQMPNVNVRWSWDAEFVDVDNDYDLDILVSSYASDKLSLLMFQNDGVGGFKDVTAGKVAQGKNALDVEPMDINGDSFIDLLTLHDGPLGRNRVLINNKNGGYTDATDLVWSKIDNPSSFDFMAAFYDYNLDKQVDIVVGALQTAVALYPDRLMISEAGKFKPWGDANVPKYQAFEEIKASNGTYAIVLADFNMDNRLDVAMAQNENAFDKKVLLGTDEIPVDTAAPLFVNYEKLGLLSYPATESLRVRCHDNKSPLMLHDFTQDAGLPYLEYWTEDPGADPDINPGTKSDPGRWYGEYLWRIGFEVPNSDDFFYRICAIDAAGNKACTPIEQTDVTGGTATESDSMSSMTESETIGVSTSVTESDSTVSDTIGTASMTQASASMTEPTDSNTIGNGVSNSNTAPTESFTASQSDSQSSATVTAPYESDIDSNTDTIDTIDSNSDLDDDGCGSEDGLKEDGGCICNSRSGGSSGLIAFLLVLARRRRRS